MENKENYEKYYPRKIADKIWQFYVHEYEHVEIYVFDEIPFKDDLLKINISEESVDFYMKNKNYGDGEGRCMDEIKEPNRYIIIVACYNFITNTNYGNLATAMHELNHCAHRILASKGERTFSHFEESLCTMHDWL